MYQPALPEINIFTSQQLLFIVPTPEDSLALLGLLEELNIPIDHKGISPNGYEVSVTVSDNTLLRVLLEVGADIQAYDDEYGWTPIKLRE
jgi:hypothetical protein